MEEREGGFFQRIYGHFLWHKPARQRHQAQAFNNASEPAASCTSTSSESVKLHKLWAVLIATLNGKSVRTDLPFEATERPSLYIFSLHLIPVTAAVVIMAFNLYGYWIGKELSGTSNQNAPKELALQLTAKFHELLIMASLSEALLTHLLKPLTMGFGLPFGSLTAATKFRDPSYIWSRDFWAMCAGKYPRKSLVVSLLLLCTMLGVVVGPSSATALIPRLDVWPAGEATMTLNTSHELLWPSTLEASSSDLAPCNHSTLGCFNPLAWDSVAANLFSYWGHTTIGGDEASPQLINVPSVSSLRSMDIRLKGSVGGSRPALTIASVQHAVIGDLVNSFRFLTFPSQSAKCKKTWSPAMCSYLDVSWFVSAMQPLVSTACLETQANTSIVQFPVINHALAPLRTAPVALNVSFEPTEQVLFHWVTLDGQLHNASIGVIVRMPASVGTKDFACAIQAQWTRSTTSTSFAGTKYIVKGAVPGLDHAILIDDIYRGRTVTINVSWAQDTVESQVESDSNTTAFEKFMRLGEQSTDLSIRIEAILSVLFVENMAHTGSGAIPLSITSNDLYLKKRGALDQSDQAATVGTLTDIQTDFAMGTSMVGYGYGLYTKSGLSVSTLISIIVLCVYSAITLVHLLSMYVSKDPYILSWREERELLLTCLLSRSQLSLRTPSPAQGDRPRQSQNSRDENVSILKDNVVVTGRQGRAELSFRGRDRLDRD